MARATIITCQGKRGWDDYLLLHHFDLSEPLDEISKLTHYLFGTKVDSRSPVSGVRDQLANDSKRHKTLEQVDNHLCLVVRSDEAFKPGGESAGYFFARHDDVPFSMVEIKVNSKKFIAGFKRTGFGLKGTPSTGAALAMTDVKTFNLLPSQPIDFDEVLSSESCGSQGHVARHNYPRCQGADV